MKTKSKDSGKLRIGDDWNAIRIIALSQNNPLKAIAEFVENSIDAHAKTVVAVATNLWDWDPKRLLQWHREKAGSIEAVHDVLKNELGGGVLPSKRFGADAAWFR